MYATVLIVDDHSGFRAKARRLLESEGYEVIGEAEDVESGLEAARTLRPQIALVDVYLPDGDGFELTMRLATLSHPPTVILTSSRDATDFERCLKESGARGFVPKGALSRAAIQEVLQ
jgi:DNA-binding NarL/FixJ family response regulator